MNAKDARQRTDEAMHNHKDMRLEKYVEWLMRDVEASTKQGKYALKVDYSGEAFRDEFILKIQNAFIKEDYEIITLEDPTRFREFTISWTNA